MCASHVVHIDMHENGKFIYKSTQMEKHVAMYTMHKMYMQIWIEITLWKQ